MRNWLLSLAAALGAAAAGAAWAQGGAGVQFLTVVGDVRIVGRDGAQRAAARGADLQEGETIQTGPNALAQLRLADGGLLSVRAETEMKLDRFAYTGKDDTNASFVVSLLKGGFRSITGLIGQLNRDGYRISTPSATIGIRGTDFDTLFLNVPRPDLQMDAGTFTRVHSGEIVMQNPQRAQQIVRKDESGFISLGGGAPRLVPLPPMLRTPTPVVQAPQPGPGADPGAPKADDSKGGQAVAPGARQLAPAASGLRMTPLDAVKPGAAATTPIDRLAPSTMSPTLVSPIQTAPATIQSPATIQAPAAISPMQSAPMITTPIQTAPATIQQTAPMITAPIQTAPSAIQQAPAAIKAPIAPIAPMMKP